MRHVRDNNNHLHLNNDEDDKMMGLVVVVQLSLGLERYSVQASIHAIPCDGEAKGGTI